MSIAPFLRIIRLSLQQQATYRVALLSGMATNLFFALLRVAVLIALYAGQDTVNGLSLPAAITYSVLAQAMIVFLSLFGSWEMMNSVYTGSIGADLLRPMPLFLLWMGRDAGRALVNLAVRGVMLAAATAIFYPLLLPQNATAWLTLPLAIAMAWLVSFSFRFLVNLVAFWIPDARGVGRVAFLFLQLFSGFLIPLRLLPDWFARLCSWTPFPALINTPLEVYLGVLRGEALWRALAEQALWALALALLAQVVLRAGMRKLVVQGG